MNIQKIIAALATETVPRSELRLLLSHVLARSAAWLAAHDDYELSASEESDARTAITRRAAGEPIAYIVGYREFYGRKFICTPAALIPRPETELLIDMICNAPSPWGGGLGRGSPHTENEGVNNVNIALNARELPTSDKPCEIATALPEAGRKLRILEVGTGTGCIAITLALELQNAQVIAVDLSRDALTLARENAFALGANNVEFIESDWFSAFVANEKFDVIVSNPPYIAPNDPHLFQGDLRFEPALALRDRIDGLESYRELVRGSKIHLLDTGLLIVEHGYDQGKAVPALLRESAFTDVEMICDLAGQPRVTRARRLFSD